jgi:hypothetical protein
MPDLSYELPEEKKFQKMLIKVLSEEYPDSALMSILSNSKISFDPSSQFTRNKWNHYWLDVIIHTSFKYSKYLQKSENKKILSDIIERILPPKCGYELYNIKVHILLDDGEEVEKFISDGEEIKEVAESEIYKYNLKYGCVIGHNSCAETSHIVEKYDVRNVFLDISYDERYVDYEEAIIEVLQVAKLNPVLAKDTIKNQALLCKVCSYIRTCKYGIADISYPSLNVAYELGILQSLNKPTAIFLERESEKPSDLSGLEHIEYTSAKVLRPLLARWIIDNVNEADKQALEDEILAK